MMLVRVVISAAVVGSVAGIANDTIGKYPGHNGCWNLRWDDSEMTDECCPLFDEECFSEFCSIPDGPFHHTCMHQVMEHYVEGEYVRARASCTVNVETCEMTCPCDDMKHPVGHHEKVHKMTTVDLGECTTFENCHGELTCTEDEFYEGCPVPPAPVEVSAAVVESVAGVANDTIGIEVSYNNGCWNLRWDDSEMTDECCPLFDEECFSEFCSVPDGPFHHTCMHQVMEHYVEGEYVRGRASCTVNVETCEMTCPCDDMKHPVGHHEKVHKMTTVDLGECTTFENCHGELTCTEDEFYEGCPVPPALDGGLSVV